MDLKILIAAVSLGLATLGRAEWESAEGSSNRLSTLITRHKATLTCKAVTLSVSDGFASKHGSMVRFLELLMGLPGSKWKMMQAGGNPPKSLFRLDKLADVYGFLNHVRVTASSGLTAANMLLPKRAVRG